MSRAKLFPLPNCIWHITHRCHNRDFLLKFKRDRERYLQWLYYVKKKYKLIILNYSITSNHIHLVVYDDGRKNIIPYSMMLVSSRIALEYNKRKNRSGAFWEDNYHATAIGKETHFHRCLVYIDLNMVRANVVDHPKDWPYCGYHEINGRRSRYLLIDKLKLMDLLHIDSSDELTEIYEGWVDKSLSPMNLRRENIWTQSIAVGDKSFVEEIERRLGNKVKYRKIEKVDNQRGYVLKEERKIYF